MEEVLKRLAERAELFVDVAAVLIVFYAAIEAFVRIVKLPFLRQVTHGERKAIWRRFGMWLLLGLEFQLAADIIGSVITPTWTDIGQLGAIAVIRTFLNYFLGKDLESAREDPAVEQKVD